MMRANKEINGKYMDGFSYQELRKLLKKYNRTLISKNIERKKSKVKRSYSNSSSDYSSYDEYSSPRYSRKKIGKISNLEL
eukprot:CAMPEP_0205805136 /NCGR_PEP_ID=MMETSP0205-20121125/8271_1 /ASSEMBLY_ACC=CAM_ASM_000278 /TAXON_ID=36767 /ORGANISM="Euplotes focardii, Strain TN1" /LENGTH=79 /DNA_ID=CAMNT_0053075875 /DNA_START=518 /DNA_END=754 /DNA_ORIENTATION=-